MLIALPNLDGSYTCTLFMPYEGKNSFESLKDDASVEQFFKETFPDFYSLMPDIVANYKEHPLSDLVIIRCFPWVRNHTLILGDASHAIVPFYGQGMNAGFEDCSVLNSLLESKNHNWDQILPEFQEIRKPDADAIADLALQNYIEMRDLVADDEFVLRKKIERKIYLKHPDKWVPLYSQVTFSNERYSEAQATGKLQDKIMAEIMQDPDIEKNWDSDATENMILRKIREARG